MDTSACASATNWTVADAEQALVEQSKQDRQAFAILYRRHYEAIARYVYRRTGDVHATEDLVADVFLTALRFLPRYRNRGNPFRSWLYAIATNAANRWARQRPRQHQPLGEQGDASVAAPEDRRDHARHARAQQALLRLAPKHQAVLVLHHVEGLSVESVARILGCRVGTVKSRLSRARQQLRAELNDWR